MAELIDKNELEKRMTEDWFLEILVTQYSKNSVKKDIENAIENLPTTTEAEIRNKAINEFFDELQKYEKDDWLKLKMLSIYHIAEQLKKGE